ncbi:MAG: hypothetical protein VKJ04_01050 [Vampirovibrionales bacterium]|nr:hypothetical protein [Vampirovibrionales bacterium]
MASHPSGAHQPSALKGLLPGKLREAFDTAPPAILLGRAWQLCRTFPKESFQAMLPAIILMMIQALASALFTLLWQKPSPEKSFEYLLLAMALGGLNVVCGMLSVAAWVVSFVVLARFYFSALLFETPYSIKSCYRYVGDQIGTLIGYAVSWCTLFAIFVTSDIFLLFLIGLLSGLLFSTLRLIHVSPWVSMGFVFALILYGSGVLILLWALLSGQMLMLHLPLVVLANADTCSGKDATQLSWLDAANDAVKDHPVEEGNAFRLQTPGIHVSSVGIRPAWMGFFALWRYAFALVFSRFGKTLLYGAICLFFLYVWLLVFDLPVLGWYAYEAAKASLRGENFDVAKMPRLALSIFQLWGTLVHACILPLYVSGATIFWYDGNVEKSGLDLRIWLARLRAQAINI